jgi:hypothetical protein
MKAVYHHTREDSMKALALVVALAAALVFTGCDDDADCVNWCEREYNVEGWCQWGGECNCVCDIPCCWECNVGDAACHDICSDDEFCSDYDT